jgi:hypothetical protein
MKKYLHLINIIYVFDWLNGVDSDKMPKKYNEPGNALKIFQS